MLSLLKKALLQLLGEHTGSSEGKKEALSKEMRSLGSGFRGQVQCQTFER